MKLLIFCAFLQAAIAASNRFQLQEERLSLLEAYKARIPENVDWRSKGVLPPVRNQGEVGSAEAFDVLDALESYHAIQTGELVSLSAQELKDCCHMGHSTGGLLENPFSCLKNIGGLCSEESYPTVNKTEPCHSNSCHPVVKIKGGAQVPAGNEAALAAAVASTPVLAAIDAGLESFMMYESGIYSNQNCSSHPVDHVVLVVGYGSSHNSDYWIIRNSWGSAWGMNGYMLLARNKDNMCGIASMASYPV